MEKKEYSNGEVVIVWQPELCIHSGICVKTLPNVYNVKKRPWITPENASTPEIIDQVAHCPSGALSIKPAEKVVEIKHENDERKGQFKAFVDGGEAGKLTYTIAGEAGIIIAHTEVNKKYQGLSIGKKLVMEAVEYARENNKKIIPLCPFAKSVFEKVDSIKDVLQKS